MTRLQSEELDSFTEHVESLSCISQCQGHVLRSFVEICQGQGHVARDLSQGCLQEKQTSGCDDCVQCRLARFKTKS